jgi:HD-like signal output (HDOD) protein
MTMKASIQLDHSHADADTGVVPAFREVARLVADPNTSTSRLAAAVARDRRLASTVLKKANSSYYYQGKEVTDVVFAVTLLGFNGVRSLP